MQRQRQTATNRQTEQSDREGYTHKQKFTETHGKIETATDGDKQGQTEAEETIANKDTQRDRDRKNQKRIRRTGTS